MKRDALNRYLDLIHKNNLYYYYFFNVHVFGQFLLSSSQEKITEKKHHKNQKTNKDETGNYIGTIHDCIYV